MNCGSHAAVAALIGTRSKKPWVVVVLAFTSHFLLDYICHDPFINWLAVPSRLLLCVSMIILDLVIGAATVMLAIRRFPKARFMILLSTTVAIMPDALFHCYLWRPYVDHSAIARAILNLHYAYHNRFGPQGVVGAGVNVILCMVVPVLLVLYLSRNRKKAS